MSSSHPDSFIVFLVDLTIPNFNLPHNVVVKFVTSNLIVDIDINHVILFELL